MDRESWLAARRSVIVAEYDADALTYDQHGYPTDMQEQWVARLLRMLQPGYGSEVPVGALPARPPAARGRRPRGG